MSKSATGPIVGALFLGACFAVISDKWSDETPSPAPPPTKREIVEYDARRLARLYQENEVRTDKEIAGRAVRMVGVVSSVTKVFGSVVVHLTTDNPFIDASGQIAKTSIDRAASLSAGQRIRMTCNKMRAGAMQGPYGTDCAIE